MYRMDSRVRFSEVDKEQNLTLGAIINYFQDCSCFHSEDIGSGINLLLQEKGWAWVLASWQIVLEKLPKYGQEIAVTTIPYDYKGFLGYRNFTMKAKDGEMLAYANSIWIFMDMEGGRPVKIPESVWSRYELSGRLEMDYAPRKISLPEDGEEMPPVAVHKSQLDTYQHVNNGQYIAMAQEYLPEAFHVRQMRADYRKAAVAGDILYPVVTIESSRAVIQLCDSEKQPYVIVEFLKK